MKSNIGIYKLLIGVVLLLNVSSVMAQRTFSGDDDGIIRCNIPDSPIQDVIQLGITRQEWLEAGNSPNSAIITIPVAFHVIRYSNGSANVTDQQITDQLDVLNASYANTNFRFSLHSIERVDNDVWVNADLYSAAEAEMKQALAIDPAHVLNFYTNDLPGGGLGYARFPWEFPEDSYMHGVVCDYASLPEGSIPNFDEGDTGVHEVGHYVGLWHTFQNDCNPPGDEVDDTPYEDGPAFGCPVGRNSCPDPGLDPIHNFMDYTYDSCMDHFTAGQSDRMDVIMPMYRPSMFPVQVTVDQRRESDELLIGTQVDRWESSSFVSYTVPIPPFNFTVGSIEVLKGMQDLISDPTEKYNNWIVNITNDDPDVRNHHQFEITSDLSNLTSRFKQTHAAITIRNEFLSAPGTDPEDDVIEFKDPWLIDSTDANYGNNPLNRGINALFKSRSSPFNPDYTTSYNGDVYQGVFLNQSGPPFWNPPYYTVRAPQSLAAPVHGQNTPFYFGTWDGHDDSVAFQQPLNRETAVVFKEPGAQARALFKGHLLSGNPNATGANNGRRIARDADGTLHAVYEDGGRIWYTHTDNGQFGQVWVGEELVYPPGSISGEEYSLQYLNPSIVEYNGVLHVVFTELVYLEGELNYAAVFYSYKDIDEEQWEDAIYVNWGFPISDPSEAPKPVIEFIRPSGVEYVVISFNTPDEEPEIQTYYKRPTDQNFTASSSVFNGNNPSLSSDQASYNLGLCYEWQGIIYRRSWASASKT